MEKKERKLTLNKQIENIPEAQMDADRNAYNSGEISPSELQESWIDAGYMTRGYSHIEDFIKAIGKFGFKQRKSHGPLSAHPEYLTLFDWEMNQEDGIFPEELTLGSSRQAWFKCGAGIHPSEKRSIYSHTSGSGCNQCGKQKAREAAAITRRTPTKGLNDLATVRHDLVPFWSDRNEKKPDEVCYASNEKFWWIDKDGNEYINQPDKRVKYPTDWSPLHHWKNNCPDHYEVYQYIRSIVPQQYPVLVEQKMLPESKEMKDKGYKQSLFVDIVVWIGPFKLLFEVNGPEHFKYGKRYHDRKIEAAAEMGYTLTHVWSHIWVMETQKCMDEIKNQIEFVLSYQTGTRGNQMVARTPVELDGEIIYRSESA